MYTYRYNRLNANYANNRRKNRMRGWRSTGFLLGVCWLAGGVATANTDNSATLPVIATVPWGQLGVAELAAPVNPATDQEEISNLAWNGARGPWGSVPGSFVNPTRPPHVPPQGRLWCVCPKANGALIFADYYTCVYGCALPYNPPGTLVPPNIGFTR